MTDLMHVLKAAAFALALPVAAGAATVTKTADFTFLSGVHAGEVLHFSFSYKMMEPGGDIYNYDPDVFGEASFMDAVSFRMTGDLIFSGSKNILSPEPYLYYDFDPAANSLGLRYFEFWNGPFGLFYADGSDETYFYCSAEVACKFTTSVVPLPAGLPLLSGALALLALWARRLSRRKAAV